MISHCIRHIVLRASDPGVAQCVQAILRSNNLAAELENFTLAAAGGSPKHFQKCSVSSAAAEHTVLPSGDCARCSTRAVCPVNSPICSHAHNQLRPGNLETAAAQAADELLNVYNSTGALISTARTLRCNQ